MRGIKLVGNTGIGISGVGSIDDGSINPSQPSYPAPTPPAPVYWTKTIQASPITYRVETTASLIYYGDSGGGAGVYAKYDISFMIETISIVSGNLVYSAQVGLPIVYSLLMSKQEFGGRPVNAIENFGGSTGNFGAWDSTGGGSVTNFRSRHIICLFSTTGYTNDTDYLTVHMQSKFRTLYGVTGGISSTILVTQPSSVPISNSHYKYDKSDLSETIYSKIYHYITKVDIPGSNFHITSSSSGVETNSIRELRATTTDDTLWLNAIPSP